MKVAFFAVLLIVASFSAMDIIFGDNMNKHDQTEPKTQSIASVIGVSVNPARRRPDVVAIFLISVVAMSVILIADMFAHFGGAA